MFCSCIYREDDRDERTSWAVFLNPVFVFICAVLLLEAISATARVADKRRSEGRGKLESTYQADCIMAGAIKPASVNAHDVA